MVKVELMTELMHPNPWAFGVPKQQSYTVKDLYCDHVKEG